MKNLPVVELKAKFSEVLEKVQQGESFGITYGESKKLIAEMNPPRKREKQKKRKFGILDGKANIVIAGDFKMSEKEFTDQK